MAITKCVLKQSLRSHRATNIHIVKPLENHVKVVADETRHGPVARRTRFTCASSSGEGYTCASRRETLVVSYNLSVLLKASGFPSFLLPLQSDFFLCPDPSRRRRRHKYRSVSLFLTLSPSSRKFFLSRSLVVGAIHSQVLILYCTRASENKTTSRATTGLSVHWPPTICTIGFCNVKSSIRFCTLH